MDLVPHAGFTAGLGSNGSGGYEYGSLSAGARVSTEGGVSLDLTATAGLDSTGLHSVSVSAHAGAEF